MTSNRLGRYLLIALLAIWAAVTIAALGGMYKLWWDRERVAYFGKTVSEQRMAIWKTSGLPKKLLEVSEKLLTTWPGDISYSPHGDYNQLSYLKYLLIPRIPAGSAVYSIDANGKFTPPASLNLLAEQAPGRFAFSGLLCSLLAACGITFVLKGRFSRLPFSFPEMFGCTVFLFMACIVISRAVLSTAVPGFYLLASAGILSWVFLAVRKTLGSESLSQAIQLPGCATGDSVRGHFNTFFISFLVGSIVLSVFWVFLMTLVVVPDDWDSWAIWGAKAKMLALGQGALFNVSYFGHADYPLLWPSIWAFSGWLGGGWEEMWSRGWAGLFFGLCIWEIVIIIERNTGRRDLGLLAGALFVSMPMTPLIASWSYAETPFWMLTTACIGCLMLWRDTNSQLSLLVAAVLAAGAAYTKNEGVLFFVLVSFWIVLTPQKQRIQALLLFAGGFLLLYLPWLYWIRIVLNLGSQATAGLHLDFENIERVAGRIPKAFASILEMWSDIKRWNIVLWASCLCAVFVCMKRRVRTDLLLPVGMLFGYLVIIVFHNDDIYWQIGTSWDRLTVQAMPLMLIVLVPYIENLLYPSRN